MINTSNINYLNFVSGEAARNPAENPEYFSFPIGDQLELSFPVGAPVQCARCGSEFVRGGKRKGRPQLFCSDECRKATVREKRTRWIAEHGRSCGHRSNLTCRVCGTAFQVQAVTGGRVPGYCSDACRSTALSQGKRSRKRRHLRGAGEGWMA
jgi:hypothetical protein